jgi:hypothetical protein
METTRKKVEIGLIVFFLVLSGLFYTQLNDYSSIAQQFPFLSILFLGVISVIRFIQLRRFSEEKQSKVRFNRDFFTVFFLVLLYMVAMPLIGFFISTTIFLPLCMWLLRFRKKIVITVLTSGTVITMYFVFINIFNVPVPESLLGF